MHQPARLPPLLRHLGTLSHGGWTPGELPGLHLRRKAHPPRRRLPLLASRLPLPVLLMLLALLLDLPVKQLVLSVFLLRMLLVPLLVHLVLLALLLRMLLVLLLGHLSRLRLSCPVRLARQHL
jgi:hypothetical protein